MGSTIWIAQYHCTLSSTKFSGILSIKRFYLIIFISVFSCSFSTHFYKAQYYPLHSFRWWLSWPSLYIFKLFQTIFYHFSFKKCKMLGSLFLIYAHYRFHLFIHAYTLISTFLSLLLQLYAPTILLEFNIHHHIT